MKMKVQMKATKSFVFLALVIVGSLPAMAAAGAVYTMNNSSTENAVMVFSRGADGIIHPSGIFPTGGKGTGAGLGSQGAIAIDAGNTFLFVVNAGSDTVSVFRITASGLQLADQVASGGQNPASLTISRQILYVLNNGGAVGGSDTIAGFAVQSNGKLKPLVSGLPLSATSVVPPQIGFNTDGTVLLVTEKGTNNLDFFAVNDDGVAAGLTVVPSAGQTPFGFAFGKRNQVIVSDAFGGAAGAGAVSSYTVSANLKLHTASALVLNNQSAPCWIVLTNDGEFAYAINTTSGSVSGYAVGFSGGLTLLNADGVTARTGSTSGPVDAAISNDSRYLYVLTPGTTNIQGFFIALDGSLSPLTERSGVPTYATGLVAR